MRAAGLPTGALLRVLAALAVLAAVVPLAALVVQTPLAGLAGLVTSSVAGPAARLSVMTSTAAVAASVVVGVPIAWVLARVPFPGRSIVRGIVMLPMVLPPVVAGVALLATLGRGGVLGGALAAAGITVPFTAAAAAVAQTFVSAPFLIVAAEAGFATVDRGLEDAATTLGGSRWFVWRTVVLPAMRPQLLAGVALCWARALGEFGATITFAGSLRGRTQTLPLAVHEQLQVDPGAAFALSLLLLVVSLALIVGLRARLVAAPARRGAAGGVA